MGSRLVFVLTLCVIAGSATLAQNPASLQSEIMLKLLLQNRDLKTASLDSLVILIYKTDADSVQLEALQAKLIDQASLLKLETPLRILARNTFKRSSSDRIVPQAVFLINSRSISLRQFGRDWHRSGILTFTNMPEQMDDGIAIAVAPDSLGQQKIFMNPRALERASASFSTEILQLTTTRYARGSGL
ncbi:MAG: hypothetical protein ACRBF0_23280 [Calditrichia bacterium]